MKSILKPAEGVDIFEAIDESTGETAKFFLAEPAAEREKGSFDNATWVRVDRAEWQQDPVYWTGRALSPSETPDRPESLTPNGLWLIGLAPWRGGLPTQTED